MDNTINTRIEEEKKVRERVLPLDAERYAKGDLPMANLLSKYCSYLMSMDHLT